MIGSASTTDDRTRMSRADQFLQRFDLLLLRCKYRSLFFEFCFLLVDQFLLPLDLRLLVLATSLISEESPVLMSAALAKI
jgi:hypothetical protein